MKPKWKKYSYDSKRMIAPHCGLELELLLQGKKPVAQIHDCDSKKFFKHVENGTLIHQRFKFGGFPTYGNLFALKHEKWRMNRLAKEFSADGRDHIKIGILLGYSKKAIKAFLEQ